MGILQQGKLYLGEKAKSWYFYGVTSKKMYIIDNF